MRRELDAAVRIEPVSGHQPEYFLERDPYLSARQVRADAGVRPRTERQVGIGPPVNNALIGIGEPCRVAVSGRVAHRHRRLRRHLAAVQSRRRRGRAPEQLDR